MERYKGTVEEMGTVDVSAPISWVTSIALEQWPQQDRMRADYPYPAMVSNPEWHGYAEVVEPVVSGIMGQFPGCYATHRMLSIVMPGQAIAEHDDVQDADWRLRIHVPLTSNEKAQMWYQGGAKFHLDVGKFYKVNTEVPHALANEGDTPRIHFFFDVKEFQKTDVDVPPPVIEAEPVALAEPPAPETQADGEAPVTVDPPAVEEATP